MLLDSSYTIIPQIRFTLTYDSGIRKVVTIKTKDTINCVYKKGGERFTITGVVTKIGCNFNSSLGAVGTTAYIQVDGSSEYAGEVVYIQPNQVLDLTIISTSGTIDNVVCSVDNDTQKITLIRENEVGVFQYSLDGVTWRAAVGAQGMSAYECAVALGFVGTEAQWLASLKGPKGDTGETGGVEIYAVFHSAEEARRERKSIPHGKLVTVITNETPYLYIRIKRRVNDNDDGYIGGICSTCGQTFTDDEINSIRIKGYDYVGVLTVGPKGDKGDPGKSAYQSAVEGGYTGTEDDFIKSLARTGVAVTNYYAGPAKVLSDTVVGPMDLRVFGYTNPETFVSKNISKIDVFSITPSINQTLIFPEPILLRSVPTTNDGAKPNIVIKGIKQIADCIMNYNGQVGVLRRVKYIESYNGETIIGDWISSTGELDLGAHVQYTCEGTFEPFSELVQSQYRKLSTYDGYTEIRITESTYISVVYPIDITNYIATYLIEHKDDILRPIVEEVVDEKIDLPEGETIATYVAKQIVATVGVVPEGKTVVQMINEVSASIEDIVNNKIGNIPEGKTVAEVIAEVATSLNDVITNKIGDIPAGKTVAQAIAEVSASIENIVNNKIGNIPGGKTVAAALAETNTTVGNNTTKINTNTNNISKNSTDINTNKTNITKNTNDIVNLTTVVNNIDANTKFTEDFVTTKEVGGLPAGTQITTADSITAILKEILCPYVPPAPPIEEVLYVGVSSTVPTDLTGLTKKTVDFDTLKTYSNRYTANDQRLVFAYSSEALEELISITDPSGFEQLDGWSHFEYTENGHIYYIYYSNETLTISSYKMTFVFVEED